MAAQELERFVPVSGVELAEMLGVDKSRVSVAAHREWRVDGKPVFEWAEWHPNGRRVDRYLVPNEFAMTASVSEELGEKLRKREKVTRTEPLDEEEDWDHKPPPGKSQ